MELKLMNYLGEVTKIADINEGDYVQIDVITGDWVMRLPFHIDTANDRLKDFFDGSVSFIATKENVDKVNACTNEFEILDIKFEVI